MLALHESNEMLSCIPFIDRLQRIPSRPVVRRRRRIHQGRLPKLNSNFATRLLYEQIKWRTDLGYDQRDAANALKYFLINQFVKFFLLIGQSNASKHL